MRTASVASETGSEVNLTDSTHFLNVVKKTGRVYTLIFSNYSRSALIAESLKGFFIGAKIDNMKASRFADALRGCWGKLSGVDEWPAEWAETECNTPAPPLGTEDSSMDGAAASGTTSEEVSGMTSDVRRPARKKHKSIMDLMKHQKAHGEELSSEEEEEDEDDQKQVELVKRAPTPLRRKRSKKESRSTDQ